MGIENKKGEVFIIKDEIKEVYAKNDRNVILAVFRICSNCRCFFSVPNARVDFSQMCLKNKIKLILDQVREMNNDEFDRTFLGDVDFKPACFMAKKSELSL
jgi:hypothetical protein